MKKRDLLTGAALAALTFAAGCGGSKTMTKGDSAAAPSAAKGECWGVNACKGQGACGGVGHECAGGNACKGEGWLSLSQDACDAKGGKFKKG